MEQTTDRALQSARASLAGLTQSGLISANSKTDFSVDTGICPLMKLVAGKYTSPVCEGCYAKGLLNRRAGLRNKLERNGERMKLEGEELVQVFESDIAMLVAMAPRTALGELKSIRFYSFGDFHNGDLPLIMVASRHLRVDIISKALAMRHNEAALRELINKPNVQISLSFNSLFMGELDRIKAILVETDARNVQLNYCFLQSQEKPSEEFLRQFQVLHHRGKASADDGRNCARFDADGVPVVESGRADSCRNCNRCSLSFVDAMGNAQRAEAA